MNTRYGAAYKDKSEPHHRVIRFGSLLSPPDAWESALPLVWVTGQIEQALRANHSDQQKKEERCSSFLLVQ